MTLLVQLAWFLLLLSILVSGAILLSKVLRVTEPEAANWASVFAVAIGCLAVLVVVMTTGYLGMRIRSGAEDEDPCGAFGLKNNSETNKRGVPKLVLVLHYLLADFPEAEKLAFWFATILCGIAVLAFLVAFTLLVRVEYKKVPVQICHPITEYGTMETNPYCWKDYDVEVMLSRRKYLKLKWASGLYQPKQSFLHKWANCASLGLLGAAIIGAVFLNYYFCAVEEAVKPPCSEFDYPSNQVQGIHLGSSVESQNRTHLLPRSLFVVPREGWLAAPPRLTKPLTHPVKRIVVSYAYLGPCSSRSDCVKSIRRLQASDMVLEGWWDITYNFLVADDDNVYEGRGWDVEALLHEEGSLTILFVGAVRHHLPRPYQMGSFKLLVDEGIRLEKISPSYKLITDREANGSLLHKELQNWENWVWKN